MGSLPFCPPDGPVTGRFGSNLRRIYPGGRVKRAQIYLCLYYNKVP